MVGAVRRQVNESHGVDRYIKRVVGDKSLFNQQLSYELLRSVFGPSPQRDPRRIPITDSRSPQPSPLRLGPRQSRANALGSADVFLFGDVAMMEMTASLKIPVESLYIIRVYCQCGHDWYKVQDDCYVSYKWVWHFLSQNDLKIVHNSWADNHKKTPRDTKSQNILAG